MVAVVDEFQQRLLKVGRSSGVQSQLAELLLDEVVHLESKRLRRNRMLMCLRQRTQPFIDVPLLSRHLFPITVRFIKRS